VDVSRFVRGGIERDVFLAWRDWGEPDTTPPKTLPRLENKELCQAPLAQVVEFLRDQTGWIWKPGQGEWVRADRNRLVPGMRVLLHATAGGYTERTGWDPTSKGPVAPVPMHGQDRPEEGVDDDHLTSHPRPQRYQQTLGKHTARVVTEARRLAVALLPGRYTEALEAAARYHDWGKAHADFQRTLHGEDPPPGAPLLAKSCETRRHSRKHLRHELASALALLDLGENDLVAYLAAAHHGRIRLTVRSMPDEPETRVRGIEEGDRLPPVDLDGVVTPETLLSLERVKLGRSADGLPSWTERMTRLRDELGPFRLAYLEALLRIADEMASADPGEEVERCQ